MDAGGLRKGRENKKISGLGQTDGSFPLSGRSARANQDRLAPDVNCRVGQWQTQYGVRRGPIHPPLRRPSILHSTSYCISQTEPIHVRENLALSTSGRGALYLVPSISNSLVPRNGPLCSEVAPNTVRNSRRCKWAVSQKCTNAFGFPPLSYASCTGVLSVQLSLPTKTVCKTTQDTMQGRNTKMHTTYPLDVSRLALPG